MGNYSYFICAMNGADTCKINWEKVDIKKLDTRNGLYTLVDAHQNPQECLTLEDLGKAFSGNKLYGYLTNEAITGLREICKNLEVTGNTPRLYFEYEGYDMAVYFEFYPGTENICVGKLDISELKGTPDENDEESYEEYVENVLPKIPYQAGWKTGYLEFDTRTEQQQRADALLDLYALLHSC